jgi:hypothetical protein
MVPVGVYFCIEVRKEPRASARLQAVMLRMVDQATRPLASQIILCKSVGRYCVGGGGFAEDIGGLTNPYLNPVWP